ncbi:uncharacterized protein LOC131213390 [Anopheles bellator]|uniref:uncharacterized protein LOC131213390 n=1 Tax=Anopheles bellator TaxID=139047 RepID=UPI00264811E6|nr:uncharacterized protein LOC131213390 [Anopheles bellator]
MKVPLSFGWPPAKSKHSADVSDPKPALFQAARRRRSGSLAAAVVTVCTVAAIFGPRTGAITVAPDIPPSSSAAVSDGGHEPDQDLRAEEAAFEAQFASENLTCPSDDGPFLLERSANSLRLYLLDTDGLQRIQTDGLALSRVPVCRLPELDDSPQWLQVLDVQLGGKDYVLFTVTTAQWHHVYLARSTNDSRVATEGGTGTRGTAQTIQRIKFAGDTAKAQLMECGGQVYLVTLVTYGSMGTIRVYRWLQSYFSLTSTREVPSLDDVRCHCPGPLLLLALDYEPLPERSLNHVLLLDGSGASPVKVQEVFFLSHSLPSFTIDDDLYLIRHVSKDKCFLYQWNGDASKFIRQRALPYRPGQIGAVTSWPGMLAVTIDGAVRLYAGGKQNAFRVESPFTVHGARQSDPLKQLAVPGHDDSLPGSRQLLQGLFRLRTDSDTEAALAMAFACPATTVNGTALRVYQLSVMSVTRATEAQELGFRTLNGCLQRLKRGLNERKQWIDLIRLQLARKNLVFDTLNHTGPGVVMQLHPGVQLDGALLPHDSPFVLPPTRTALNGQALLLRHYRLATDLNRVLLVNRAKTDIQGDLHVRGNVRTRQTKIRAVDALEERTPGTRHRKAAETEELERGRRPRHPPPYRIVRAREVISADGSATQKRFWSRTAMTVLPGTVQLDELHAGSVRLEGPGGPPTINHLPLPGRATQQDVAEHGYRGHKVFRSVRTGRLHAHRYNGAPLAPELIESSRRTVSDGATIRADRCHTRNLIVRSTVNGFRLDRFASVRQPHVNGNLRLGEGVCVRHLHVHRAVSGAPRGTLLDRLSNQTITGPSFISKAFTHSLHFGELNGEPSANLATIHPPTATVPAGVSGLLISTPVRTGRLRIRGDLIANHEQQQWSGEPIGTRPADLRQQYRGKLLLNGSLRVRAAILSAPNVTVMGVTVPTLSLHPEHYLQRRQRQAVNHPVTYRAAQFQYLFANTLNGAALWQLSLTHHGWQNSIYLQDATVGGHIRPARIAPRLHAIKQARVGLHSRVALCDMKHFTGTLRVTALHTDTLGGRFPTAVLWERGAQRYASTALTTAADLELRSTALLVGGDLYATTTIASHRVGRLRVPSVRARYRALHLAAIDANTATLHQTVNVSLGEIVDRFAAGGTTDGHHRLPSSFARIVPGAGAPAQHMPAVTVGSINYCPVDWLLGESVAKQRPSDAGARSVGGWKSVREGAVTVAGELLTASLNAQVASALDRVVTRTGGQSVEARWQFGSVSAPHLTAKVLNRTPLGRLALRTDRALALHDELFVGQLHVASLEWAGVPGGWPFETPVEQRATVVQLLRCRGTVLEPPPHDHDLSPPPHWPLLFAPTPDGPIEGLVIFDTREVHLGRSTQHAAGPPIERIAKQCFRCHPSLAPVFDHGGQVLYGPVTVRGNLRLTEGIPLTVGTVSGVSLAERLTPGGPGHVFLLGGAGRTVSGRKRWNGSGGASAGNVTLWAVDESWPLQRVLAVCSAYQRCTGALHFGRPVTVDQLLTVAHLNRIPFDLYFYAFAHRRHPGVPGSPHAIQDFPGTLTVAGLVMAGRGTILHHINGIPLTEVVSRTTPNASHQLVGGPKAFRAVRIGGPLSLHHLNRVPMARIAQTSLYGGDGGGSYLESIVFNHPVELGELRTGSLQHSRTGSTALTGDGGGGRRSALSVPDLLLVVPPSARVRSLLPPSPPPLNGTGKLGLQFDCAPDRRSLAIRTIEVRSTPLMVPLPDGHCHTVIGAVPLNDTTALVLLLITRPKRVSGATVAPLAYTYDIRRNRLHPLELPPRLGSRAPLATVLLTPTPQEIMLALLPGPRTPPATAVLLYRLVDWATESRSEPHFTHFQTITAAGPVATVATSTDGTTLILHEQTSEPPHSAQRHHRYYVYNAVTGWTEGLENHP